MAKVSIVVQMLYSHAYPSVNGYKLEVGPGQLGTLVWEPKGGKHHTDPENNFLIPTVIWDRDPHRLPREIGVNSIEAIGVQINDFRFTGGF